MYSQGFELVNRIFKAAHGRAAAMGATIMLTFQRNGIGFGFCPPYPTEQLVKTRIAYNVPQVCEPVRRAQAVALLILSNRRDRRAGWAKGAFSDRSRKPAVIRCGSFGVSQKE